ncbi:unnamed protein product [Phytophthora fragariaefolia]|uniref:Unnamed protein product n=1 Tax=Phytophthora fragariaefolia TaxID=1490495 RepID=A0A9W6YPT3_9STRA|nr:unnamed protein product [Phytophthora fragariaefolia]
MSSWNELPMPQLNDDPASSVQAVATSCELTDCDVAEPAAAAPTDAAEWDDGPNAGAAHQSRRGVTIREAKSPDQASEREHLSRVDFARQETAELSAESEEGGSVREAIDSLLSDEIEVSDVTLADDPEEDLRLRFVAAMAMCKGKSITVVDNSATDPAQFECSANEIDLEDYAHELAFLPDLTDSASSVLDYGGSNVVCSAHTPSQRGKLVKALKAQEGIMIASGNALSPPAYGTICDIDVQGHKPIKQRARRVPLKHLKKLYELLKGLLKAGLIAFSNSPWASPIVIVLKKNGVDTRLCIDYKMVSAITVLMEYAMPLVDDLLTELESYLWFCSLDAASGFWAAMMNQRARAISAFVCALGHFEWLRRMQGFFGALNYYSPFIQNMAVYGAVLYQLKDADFADGGHLAAAKLAFAELKTKGSNAPILHHFDSSKEVYIMLFANAWALSSTLLQPHDGLLHPVRFCGRVLKENEVNYNPAEKEVLALLHILKVGHTLFAVKTLHVYTRFSTLEWVFTSKSLYGRAVSFAVLLSPYHLKVKRIRELDAAFAQLLQATVTPHIGLEESLSHLAPPSKNSATVRLDPELLYAHVPPDFVGHVLSFDGSAKTEKNGGYARSH